MVNKDLAFIVSAGRTGTTFLGNTASKVIEGCFSVHEPDNLSVNASLNIQRIREFGLWHMVFGRMLGLTGPRSVGTRYLLGSTTKAQARRQIEKMRSEYFARQDSPLIIESNPQWHYAIELIPGVWPDAKMAIITRDPRTWIQSWMQKGVRHTRIDLARYFPPGRVKPGVIGESGWAKRWHKLSTFGRLAWEWQNVNGRLMKHAEHNPLCRVFRYESLFGNQARTEMEELVEFLAHHKSRQYRYDIPDDFTRVRHHASSGQFPDWRNWPSDKARLVESLCGVLMGRLGYGNEPRWRQKLEAGS